MKQDCELKLLKKEIFPNGKCNIHLLNLIKANFAKFFCQVILCFVEFKGSSLHVFSKIKCKTV